MSTAGAVYIGRAWRSSLFGLVRYGRKFLKQKLLRTVNVKGFTPTELIRLELDDKRRAISEYSAPNYEGRLFRDPSANLDRAGKR